MTLESIRSDIGENCVWISVDETSGSCCRYVGNFVVGKLHPDEPGKPNLLACKMLEKNKP